MRNGIKFQNIIYYLKFSKNKIDFKNILNVDFILHGSENPHGLNQCIHLNTNQKFKIHLERLNIRTIQQHWKLQASPFRSDCFSEANRPIHGIHELCLITWNPRIIRSTLRNLNCFNENCLGQLQKNAQEAVATIPKKSKHRWLATWLKNQINKRLKLRSGI